jgi:predicted O-methyltransferase YrrM
MTPKEQWAAVDHYLEDRLALSDSALSAALEDSQAAGLPAISVTPNQGKFLHLVARLHGARTILEIGTLGGYSTIWLARALPAGGHLITLEASAKNAAVARANFMRAGVADLVDLRLGPALELLPQLAAEKAKPFDLIFIDADKPSTPEYFTWALKLSRLGSLIVVDNVIRDGAIADAESADPGIIGMRRFFDLVAKEKRVSATALQTVGSKGYDGFSLALVIADSDST